MPAAKHKFPHAIAVNLLAGQCVHSNRRLTRER